MKKPDGVCPMGAIPNPVSWTRDGKLRQREQSLLYFLTPERYEITKE